MKNLLKQSATAVLLAVTLIGCANNPPDRWERGQVTMAKIYEKTVKDTTGIGAVGGAAAGAAVGHQFGKGAGKDWATGAGAVAGLLLGDAVEGEMNSHKETWMEAFIALESGPSIHMDREITNLYRELKVGDWVQVKIGHTIFGTEWYELFPVPKDDAAKAAVPTH